MEAAIRFRALRECRFHLQGEINSQTRVVRVSARARVGNVEPREFHVSHRFTLPRKHVALSRQAHAEIAVARALELHTHLIGALEIERTDPEARLLVRRQVGFEEVRPHGVVPRTLVVCRLAKGRRNPSRN